MKVCKTAVTYTHIQYTQKSKTFKTQKGNYN